MQGRATQQAMEMLCSYFYYTENKTNNGQANNCFQKQLSLKKNNKKSRHYNINNSIINIKTSQTI